MTNRIYRKFTPEFKREAVRLAEQTDGVITPYQTSFEEYYVEPYCV